MHEANQLTILKAEQTQAPEISALIGEVLGSYDLYHLRPSYVDEDVNDLLSNYFNNNGYFWSAHDEVGTIVATVAVYRIDDQTCELKKMYLRLQDQGKGIGKQLLNIDQSGLALPFEIISMLLLAAMIGCIVIAMRQGKTVDPIQTK